MVRVEALRRVSVPYRGTTFLNSILSCNVSGTEEDVSVPYRGTTFLNGVYINVRRYIMVSVPYRGTTFLNVWASGTICRTWKVSVPYRGTTFLNKENKAMVEITREFPSPIGELHFSMGRG